MQKRVIFGCLGFTFILVGLGGLLTYFLYPYPWHASCTVQWSVPGTCKSFHTSIVAQLKAWEGPGLCPNSSTPTCPQMPCGQNCLYTYKETQDNLILASHATPVARYVDDITFAMTEREDHCEVNAKSTSTIWYAVLDMGTNYCNLRNLAEGAGLVDEVEGSGVDTSLTEVTSDAVCTQYSSRDCSRF